MSHFHNTIAAQGAQLDVFEEKNAKQDEIILKIFQNAPNGLSPWRALSIAQSYGYRFPITSCRRAITNLAKAGKLVKTGRQIKGVYGVVEYVWRIV